jgi:hypothetical protein
MCSPPRNRRHGELRKEVVSCVKNDTIMNGAQAMVTLVFLGVAA